MREISDQPFHVTCAHGRDAVEDWVHPVRDSACDLFWQSLKGLLKFRNHSHADLTQMFALFGGCAQLAKSDVLQADKHEAPFYPDAKAIQGYIHCVLACAKEERE